MKKIYSLVGMLAIGSAAVAQNGVTEHFQKSAQTQTPAIQSQNEDAGNRAVLWSEDFASGIPATWSNVTVSGPVDWKYTTVGHTGDYPTSPIQSTTSGNGWAIVDSDGDNFSGGGAEDSQLTTDVIDLTGSGDIKLEFMQMFREWQADITTVRLTTDGGNNWTDWVINDGIGQAGTPNPDIVTLNITAAVAANPANVQIQFWWQGSWDYGWQIDDINISDIPPNDLRIRKPSFAGTGGIEYYQNTATQAVPYTFSAFIKNQGLNDQTNVNLEVDVDDGSGSVFSGTGTALATQPVDQEDSFSVATAFTPAGVGTYTATYSATSDQTDDDPSNNTLTTVFQITECTMARDNDIFDGRLSNGADSYEYGCLYEISAGEDLTSISVFIEDSTDGAAGVLAYGVVYEDDGAGGQTYMDQTSDYTIQASDVGGWITLNFNNPVALTGGGLYYIMVGHYGGPDALYIGRGTNAAAPQTCFILDGADNTWYYTTRTPMVRAGVGCPVGVEELTENGITLGQNQPNPFNGTTNINYELTEATNVTFEVVDVTGKVVMELNEGNIAAGAHNIVLDADKLESGVYFYSIITDNNRITQQMVVTK